MSEKSLPHRKSIRLKDFDYSRPGAYFVTICTYRKTPLLSHISDKGIILKPPGLIVKESWKSISDVFPTAQVDEFIIMPNHIHGIIILKDHYSVPYTLANQEPVVAGFPGPPANISATLGKILARFKYITTREINSLWQSNSRKIWQRSYYEHVIRNEDDLRICREYIINNPAKWQLDRYYGNVDPKM